MSTGVNNRRFTLMTRDGHLYKEPDGEPFTAATQEEVIQKAQLEGLRDWMVADLGDTLIRDDGL